MPLDTLFFPDDHPVLPIDDHLFSDHISTAAWPSHHRHRGMGMRTALNTGAPASAGGGELEEPERSLMEIQSIGLPEKSKLDDLATACNFDHFQAVFGDASGSGKATRSAKGLGGAIDKSAQCTETASDMVLNNIFGQKLNPTVGGMGVALTKTHDIPLGSLSKKSIKSTQDSCQDFGNFLLRRLEKPGEKVLVAAGSDAGANGILKFTSKDATHAMKSYGLCLDGIGETTALQGCEMGDLQHMGTREAANLCKVVEGPMAPGIVCVIS